MPHNKRSQSNSIPRRDFIKYTATSAGALGVTSAFGGVYSASASEVSATKSISKSGGGRKFNDEYFDDY